MYVYYIVTEALYARLRASAESHLSRDSLDPEPMPQSDMSCLHAASSKEEELRCPTDRELPHVSEQASTLLPSVLPSR